MINFYIKNSILTIFFLLIVSCSSLLKYEKAEQEFKTEEFDKKVKIVEIVEVRGEVLTPLAPPAISLDVEKKPVVANKKTIKQRKPVKVHEKELLKQSLKAPLKREPEIEDAEGFDNQRRPIVDPFKIGEKIVHEVSYLGASAAELSLSVKPYALVNGKKNYNFYIEVKTYPFFSRIYAVDDQFQTYLDFETLNPGAFKLDIKDSKQVKEARAFFDFENLKASYWEHRYTESNGHEEKKLNWTILPHSQNLVSAIFYMRIFKWTLGKEYLFGVADDEKNVIFKAKALEKVNLSTSAGNFKAIKLKAEVVVRGNLSKAKDFYIWLSDDDRKFVLRIEVGLPLGTLVSEAVKITEGH